MRIVDVIEATALYRAPDGRLVFRPWAKWGPCYLVEEQHRPRFRRALVTAYLLFFIAIPVASFNGGVRSMFLLGLVWMALMYLLFWVLSRGLPHTTPPVVTKAERVEAVRRVSGLLGRRALITLLAISLIFVVLGLVLTAMGQVAAGLPAAIFFGACAVVYAWQLRLTKRPPN